MKIDKYEFLSPGLIDGPTRSDAEYLGGIVWLWSQSERNKNVPLHALHNFVIPVITRKQFTLVTVNDEPFFYLSWAYMNIETEKRYLENGGTFVLQDEWKSGDRMWLIDWVAPFGESSTLYRLLYRHILHEKFARYLDPKGKERGLRVKLYRGINVDKATANAWYNEHPVQLAAK